jgi:hypothetical protein
MLTVNQIIASMELRQAMEREPSLRDKPDNEGEHPIVKPFVRRIDSNGYVTYHQAEEQYPN